MKTISRPNDEHKLSLYCYEDSGYLTEYGIDQLTSLLHSEDGAETGVATLRSDL